MEPSAYPIFNDIVNERYSCRQYTPEPVPEETILSIINAARLAPSACNRQPWKFVIVNSDSPLRKAVIDSYDRAWVADIPVFIIACGLHNEGWKRGDGKDHTDIDLAIAVEHICLAATSLGLSTCWICNFDSAALTKSMELPEGVEPIVILPVGYALPRAKVPEKVRKPLEEIISWGKF